MSTCCCSLAGTRACDTCPNGPSRYPYQIWPIPIRTKIIEKYENGKLIERIIEEGG